MLTTGMQNPPEPLARAQAAYHDRTARLAPTSAAAAGFRAVQSTPLVDGHLIGMVSTHFQRPRRPSDRDLRTMKLYADFAAEALTRHLGRPSCAGPADPVGGAMVPALLDPARVREADVSVPFELWVMGRMPMSFVRRAGRRGPSAQPA